MELWICSAGVWKAIAIAIKAIATEKNNSKSINNNISDRNSKSNNLQIIILMGVRYEVFIFCSQYWFVIWHYILYNIRHLLPVFNNIVSYINYQITFPIIETRMRISQHYFYHPCPMLVSRQNCIISPLIA